jgi:competence protein ComEA
MQSLSARAWLVALVAPPAVAAAALGAVFLFLHAPAAANAGATSPAVLSAPPPETGLLVHVTGAVVNPGIYRLARGLRVEDAVAAAGGLAPDADSQRLPDLAGRLRDGEQVRVPPIKGGGSSARTGAVNLNSASVDELAAVPGFTVELAQAAVDYRSHYGGFESTRELATMLGMGAAEYIQAKRYLRV